jgi:hypothetical protein
MDISKAKQVKIDYRPQDDTLEHFIETNADKHIYLVVDREDLFQTKEHLNRLHELCKYKNWTLQIPLKTIADGDKVDEIKFNAIKDCCNKYMFTDLIGNWEILQFIIHLQPSEVYITNILGFCLDQVSIVCKRAGIKVRVYANIAQSAWDGLPAIKKFFIRPEDIRYYENYVDGGIEFKTPTSVAQEVVYDAYEREYWFGNLSEIIIGLDTSLDSRRLPTTFGLLRAECHKRCLSCSSCSTCRTMEQFAEILTKTDTQVIPDSKRDL